ncbi:MAG: 6-carboxytetrahydropterin synthase [Chloracidobacterium sp.]|uniref:6-carboxy-5,6,7,8-tetrahydropterin synthase n=1 Tax=Chloracidobacterium validum TaxID=2821543 RepID=A0ABX8BAQ3_9BACT|nr:6-carboxytetrahydropterin synthase [Chloracidobacterium validum]QUW02713.1 6-carboxytetrahydropterin synthase [Chloracidobacterium validum]
MSNRFYEVMVETQFSAAHALRHYRGQGETVHGHNWRIQVFVRGEKLDENHILVDFRTVREATEEVMHYLDHKHLNELAPFDKELNPSTENIAAFVFHQVSARINTPHCQVSLVRAWETASTMAAYGLS